MTPTSAPSHRVTPVDVERILDAPLGSAWAALTDPALISRWFTACSRLSARRYQLRFSDADGDHTKTARVISLRRRGDSACYAVLLADPGYPDSTVAVTLSAASADTCRLVLHHADPPEQLLEGYRTGWPDYLDALARLVGTTGRSGVRRPEPDRPRSTASQHR